MLLILKIIGGIYFLLYIKITGFTYLLVEAEKGIIWGDQPG